MWLPLGLLSPRRVVMGDVGELVAPPYGLTDNAETLLAVSDLVFLDPVSTGYSRVVTGSKPAAYHGYQGAVESVAELIRLWLSRNGRWMSPKLLAGESYGTLRAAALAELLQSRYGIYLNGLVLVSSVLDLSSIDFENQRNDRASANYLPTYAAVAHYHGRLGERPLEIVLAEAQAYAARDSRLRPLPGLAADRAGASRDGRRRGPAHRPPRGLRRPRRPAHRALRFCGELLRDERRVVGRLDGRFTGRSDSPIAEMMDADSSYDAIVGPYAAAMNHYVRAELGYSSDLHYEQISPRVQPWSYKDFEGRPVDATSQLERAMRQNPHLLVHVASGTYDLATPAGAAQDVFAHLRLPAQLRANIEHASYPAGHMMYVHEPSRLQQSRDARRLRATGLPRAGLVLSSLGIGHAGARTTNPRVSSGLGLTQVVGEKGVRRRGPAPCEPVRRPDRLAAQGGDERGDLRLRDNQLGQCRPARSAVLLLALTHVRHGRIPVAEQVGAAGRYRPAGHADRVRARTMHDAT